MHLITILSLFLPLSACVNLVNNPQCLCPFQGKRKSKLYCGFEISNDTCMYHTAYDCTGLKQLPNTLAPVLTYCSNSRCGKLRIQSGFNTQPSIGCLDLDTEEYFKDMESGKAPKCEGCWFTSVKDGYKYADNFFYHDSLDGFYTVYKNDKNQWVNSTFFKLPGLA
ncbi:uncharacterized protein LOC110858782 [Folsomia candida]|uniref:uncharacterized protein LOC110858782 n=1 Tax=Folsomia candida TaxID=158441 RepID=UPI000B8F52C3|nr:uncharacterized protein LOC110858782 [Folsomia candida]